MAHRYGLRPSDIVFDTRPDAFLRLSVDMAVASRAQADEAARYEAARRKSEEERGERDDGHADRGKNRKPSRQKREKDKPLSKKVLTGEIGQAVDPALEREWVRLGGRPLAVEARDTRKKEADFATYIARRTATMQTADAAQNGHGGVGGSVGQPAEGQP